MKPSRVATDPRFAGKATNLSFGFGIPSIFYFEHKVGGLLSEDIAL
jgi:hypothetical protein